MAEIENQLMMGEKLLVPPENMNWQRDRAVLLPRGMSRRINLGTYFADAEVAVDPVWVELIAAELNDMPLYMRQMVETPTALLPPYSPSSRMADRHGYRTRRHAPAVRRASSTARMEQSMLNARSTATLRLVRGPRTCEKLQCSAARMIDLICREHVEKSIEHAQNAAIRQV